MDLNGQWWGKLASGPILSPVSTGSQEEYCRWNSLHFDGATVGSFCWKFLFATALFSHQALGGVLLGAALLALFARGGRVNCHILSPALLIALRDAQKPEAILVRVNDCELLRMSFRKLGV